MSKPYAVEGCTFKSLDPPLSLVSATITTPASLKAKAGNKGIYRGPIQVVCVVMYSGFDQPGQPNVITVNPSVIQKSKVENQSPLAEGDTGTMSMTFVNSGTGATQVADVTIEIDNAGQDVVNGN